tara:strand:- start:729 stop:2117 length:1389 start_codon:yes stop_codon:yes gene_type:complete
MLKINYNYFLTFIISSFFLFSINVNPNRLFDEDYSILNYLRFFAPSLIVLVFFIFKKKNFQKIDLSFENRILFLIFIVFLISDLINGLSANIFYYLNFFIFFFYIILIKKIGGPKLLKLNFYYMIFGYLIIIIFLGMYKYIHFENFNNFSIFDLRNYSLFFESNSALSNNPSINSTGVSRVILILLVLIIYLDITKKKISIPISIILFCLSFIIISFQSKFSILSIVIIYFLLLLCDNTYSNKKITNFIFVFLLPLLVFNTLNFENETRITKTINNLKAEITKPLTQGQKENKQTQEIIFDKKSKKQNFKKNEDIESLENIKSNNIRSEITTGRHKIWIEHINYFTHNNILFFGQGIYSDLKIFEVSSSNAIIYTFLSGGIISLILLIIIYLKFFIKYLSFYYEKFFLKKINKNEIYLIIFSILILRSIIENGFVSIQFDFYLTVILIEIINFTEENKNKLI